MSRDVDNRQDILDGRDVIRRFEELDNERDNLNDDVKNASGDEGAFAKAEAAYAEWVSDNGDEWANLRDFIEEGSSEWRHGCTLIRDTYFEDYARELAGESGDKGEFDNWPHTCIDWEQAAKELQQDYTTATFDGTDYLYR